MTLVGWTTRLRFVGGDYLASARRRGPRVVYAFWHQRQAFFTWSHRDYKASILVSGSKDGEMIARVMELSGLAACRGSSSRGAAAAAKAMLEASAAGYDV